MIITNVTFPWYCYILLRLLFSLLLPFTPSNPASLLAMVTEKSSVLQSKIPTQNLKIGHCHIQVLCNLPYEAIHWATFTHFGLHTLVSAVQDLPSLDFICTANIYLLFVCENRVLL
jgi:hypothetical protein